MLKHQLRKLEKEYETDFKPFGRFLFWVGVFCTIVLWVCMLVWYLKIK